VNQPNITVHVLCRFPLDQAGLEALLARLPGIKIIPLDSSDPPQVLVFDYGNSGFIDPPERSSLTALLLLVPGDECPDLPADASTGVLGLFSKNETAEALSIAIRQLSRGEAYLSPALALSLLKRKQSQEDIPEVELSTLTEREREVLGLLAEGLSNKAIAARLYLSVRTVDGHLSKLYARLGVRSRTEAMRLAINLNLVHRIR
jgi:DNA-binding NarL/FixJ family response regulator